jgi:hypothetical protein
MPTNDALDPAQRDDSVARVVASRSAYGVPCWLAQCPCGYRERRFSAPWARRVLNAHVRTMHGAPPATTTDSSPR